MPASGPRTMDEQQLFGAVSFRIHPAFTLVKALDGKKTPNGIEAVIEFQDQFGDPTRAAGKIRFELFTYISADPTHRGARLAMWQTTLDGRDDQLAHWDAATRAYTFQLAYPNVRTDLSYVLAAQFDRAGGRLFDDLIIEPTGKEGFRGDRRTQHAPPGGPTHGGLQ